MASVLVVCKDIFIRDLQRGNVFVEAQAVNLEVNQIDDIGLDAVGDRLEMVITLHGTTGQQRAMRRLACSETHHNLASTTTSRFDSAWLSDSYG